MSFLQQQTLVYSNREDDLVLVSNALGALGRGDIASAQRLLIAYHDYLLRHSSPKLVDYDPQRAAAEAR